MIVTICLPAQRKLDALDLDSRKKFLNIIYNCVHNKLAHKQAKKLAGPKNKIRIRYNLNYRIIAILIKLNSETQLRILDFISHDQMDRKQYFNNLEGDWEELEIYEFSSSDDDPHISTELREKINRGSLWSHELNLEEIINNYPLENDFYLYKIASQEGQTLDLSLSPEQYKIVEQDLPLFLAGSAGSGKTTIALYHAVKTTLNIQQQGLNQTVAYVTYNKHLRDYAERVIQQIYPLEKLPNLKLFNYQSLCEDLGIKTPDFLPTHQVTQQKFINEFFQHRPRDKKSIDPIALWQEIRHLIKGSVSANQQTNHLISKDDYHQKCTHFREKWELIYELAQEYQTWLNNKEYWDEIDLTHLILKNRNREKYEYNFLYCDEVQDLTEIQINLLLRLLHPPDNHQFPNFFFTGDTAQIINPSGFSWKKIKAVLYHNY